MEKEVKKNSKLGYSILLLIIIIGIIILFIKYFSPYYLIQDRVDNIKKYKGNDDEDAIGWLRVQGTNIDFPIVYYDDTDVTNPDHDLGWSFSKDKTLTKKVTIYSHNVLNVSSNPIITDKNHSRFEQLMSFIYPSFLEKNKYIQYTVGGKNYLYKIYAVSFQKEEEVNEEKPLITDTQISEYIEKEQKNSYFKFDINVKPSDDLISLVTCTRFFGPTSEYSFVVDARRVRNEEKVKNYGITEKKSYNRIKKIMEGEKEDDEDEQEKV